MSESCHAHDGLISRHTPGQHLYEESAGISPRIPTGVYSSSLHGEIAMSQIVGVHGIGNYHAKQTTEGLSAAWTTSLRAGYPVPPQTAPSVEVAYYSPLLRVPQAQGDDDVDHLPAAQQVMIKSWLQSLQDIPSFSGVEDPGQGLATVPIRAALSRVASRSKINATALNWFVARFFAEVSSYMDPTQVQRRSATQRVVLDAIKRNRPSVVIAHSLGSVVTWEALCANPDIGPVKLLLTVGSPLAMPHVIFDALSGGRTKGGRLPRPPQVRRWVNLTDPGDLIAIPRPLSDYFEVDLELESAVGMFDFHSADRYLRNPVTASLVYTALAESL